MKLQMEMQIKMTKIIEKYLLLLLFLHPYRIEFLIATSIQSVPAISFTLMPISLEYGESHPDQNDSSIILYPRRHQSASRGRYLTINKSQTLSYKPPDPDESIQESQLWFASVFLPF